MISCESGDAPTSFDFDVVLAAVGYEKRCRWAVDTFDVQARRGIGLEFGFLTEGAYSENKAFFENRGYSFVNGIEDGAPARIAELLEPIRDPDTHELRVFVDISSMSREMIANVVLALRISAGSYALHVQAAYSPSSFKGSMAAAPIRLASPIKDELAGWSARPEQPLGAIFGLGCEPNLALGALQVLEPDKAWVFIPKGVDPSYDDDMKAANKHIGDIFDVTLFEYSIKGSERTRGRLEALLNSIDGDYRCIIVPFGPKIFAWLAMLTVVFTNRSSVGVWAFSSREQGAPVDRAAEGTVVWYSCRLCVSSTD